MTVKVARWGNSLGVRVPASVAGKVGLKAGTEVELVAEDQVVKLIPVRRARRYRLAQLLSGVRKENLHGETRTGGAVGAEIVE